MALSMELRPLSREDLELTLKEYEATYGVTSDLRDMPFTDAQGVLRETEDWRQWDAVYAIWSRCFAEHTVSAQRDVLPGWVLSLEDYRRWVPMRLDETGALVEPEPLDAYELPLRQQLGGTVESGFYVPPHRVTFADGLALQFEFALFEMRLPDGSLHDFELDTYSFGLRRPSGVWIWRYDKHSRAHHGFSQRTHVHEGPDETPLPSHEVDLDEVLILIATERDSGVYRSYV